MTREEAIKILELETRQEALSPYLDRPIEEMLDSMIEASRMGASALRAQPAKLDRNRWGWCRYCDGGQGIVTFEIPDEIEVPKDSVKFGWVENPKYCPSCGKPQTEEAWAELEQRIGGNDEKAD